MQNYLTLEFSRYRDNLEVFCKEVDSLECFLCFENKPLLGLVSLEPQKAQYKPCAFSPKLTSVSQYLF